MSGNPADTPMFTQYRGLKARCADDVLVVRIGDF